MDGQLDKQKDIEFQRLAMLAAIIEGSDDAIISKTLEGVITTWNRGAEKIFGYTAEEAIGKPINLLIPPDRQDEEPVIIENIRNGRKVEHYQTIRMHKLGHELHISLTVSPIRDSQGRVIGASKIARDISLQKQAEEQIRELNMRKDAFIAMATHELKTPLTSLTGYLQLLRQAPDNPNSTIFIEKAATVAKKMVTLVNDLFDMSKIQAGKLQLDLEQFELNSFVADLLDTYKAAYPQFRFQLHAGQEVMIEADKMRLEQVFSNLLNNAIKYSDNKPLAEVFINTEETAATVQVKDYGIGIKHENQQHIFTAFYREEGLSKIPGLGLGLAITKEIIERHKGNIWLESEPGKGTVFTFTLPLTSNN
jgi:PAS domain S-box-containing protein